METKCTLAVLPLKINYLLGGYKMKKLFTIYFAIVMFFVIAVNAVATPTVFIDNKVLSMASQPVVENGTTLVPMRAIFEALGCNVNFDATTGTITGSKDSATITLKLNSKVANRNGQNIALSTPAKATNGTTYVPLRFIGESLNCTVNWQPTTQTINIVSSAENSQANLYKVIRVVDGDTIVIDYNGIEEKVRLIGVDTPESVHPDSSKNTEAGITASEYTKALLTDKSVSLEFDVQERDTYGRLLAYVYLDGKMVNKTLLEEGYANIATYPPNVKYVDDFTAIIESRNQQTVINPSTDETTYYRTATGKKYHINPNCNGGTYIPCTLAEAQKLGLTACEKCAK